MMEMQDYEGSTMGARSVDATREHTHRFRQGDAPVDFGTKPRSRPVAVTTDFLAGLRARKT